MPDGPNQAWMRPAVTIATVLSWAVGLVKDLRNSVALLRDAPAWIPLTLATILTVGLVLEWKHRRSTRSRVVNPEPFRTFRGHEMIGREDDVARLSRMVDRTTIVFLSGESGSGKSTIVRHGLVNNFRASTSERIAHIESLGAEWSLAPYRAFHRSLALSRPTRGPAETWQQRLFPGMKVPPQRVVVVFDQFDDYVLQFRANLVGSDGAVLGPDALCDSSQFWTDIRAGIGDGVITCVFVFRDEAAPYMEAVRFGPPESYVLGRISTDLIEPLLVTLGSGAVSNPENGYDRLIRRVAADFAQAGAILPVRMRRVVGSLPSLPVLTEAAYDGRGGLRGLEASTLKMELDETARAVGLRAADLHRLLLGLVSPDARKTVAQPIEKLIGNAGVTVGTQAIERAFENLLQRGFLRRVLDHDGEWWRLDHDYLATTLLDLEFSEAKLQRLLWERSDTFARAETAISRWQQLLSPLLQVQVLHARARGRLRYQRARPLALWSLLKFPAHPSVIAGVLTLWAWHTGHRREELATRFSSLSETSTWGLSEREAKALREIAKSPASEKAELVEYAFETGDGAHRFRKRADYLIHALVGTRKDQVPVVFGETLERCTSLRWDDAAHRSACVQLILSLGVDPGVDPATPAGAEIRYVANEILMDEVEVARNCARYSNYCEQIVAHASPALIMAKLTEVVHERPRHTSAFLHAAVRSLKLTASEYQDLLLIFEQNRWGGNDSIPQAEVLAASVLLAEVDENTRRQAISRLWRSEHRRDEAVVLITNAVPTDKLPGIVAALLDQKATAADNARVINDFLRALPKGSAAEEPLLETAMETLGLEPDVVTALGGRSLRAGRRIEYFRARSSYSYCLESTKTDPWLTTSFCDPRRLSPSERRAVLLQWVKSAEVFVREKADQGGIEARRWATVRDILSYSRTLSPEALDSILGLEELTSSPGGPPNDDYILATSAVFLHHALSGDHGSDAELRRLLKSNGPRVPAVAELLDGSFTPFVNELASGARSCSELAAIVVWSKEIISDQQLLGSVRCERTEYPGAGFWAHSEEIIANSVGSRRLSTLAEEAAGVVLAGIESESLDDVSASAWHYARYAHLATPGTREALGAALQALVGKELPNAPAHAVASILAVTETELTAKQYLSLCESVARNSSGRSTAERDAYLGAPNGDVPRCLALAARVKESDRMAVVSRLKTAVSSNPTPPCSLVGPVLPLDDLSGMLAAVELPHCPSRERDVLATTLGDRLVSRGQALDWMMLGDEGEVTADWWRFSDWLQGKVAERGVLAGVDVDE